jgi:hypothetical protein
MSLLIQNAAEVQLQYAHWFFYGRSRAGKTTAAGTFPRPLFLVPKQEGSHMTLLGRSDVDFVVLEGSRTMVSALDDLDARHARAAVLWKKGDDASLAKAEEAFPWGTVVVESLTHYCDLMQEELTDGDKQQMSQWKWGKISTHLRHIQTRLRNLPIHAIFTSLDEEIFERDNDGKSVLVAGRPMFPGKMSFKLPSACDCILHFERKAGKPNDIFTAHFQPNGVWLAGCRPPQLKQIKALRPFNFSEVKGHFGW